MLSLPTLFALFSALPVFSAPSSLRRNGVTPLTTQAIDDLSPFTNFAAAAYCGVTEDWSCGTPCDAIPDFEVSLAGGDGTDVQSYFVGYWPTQNTIIVSHEGTDPTKFLSLLTDVEIAMTSPDPSLFPNTPSDVQIHEGFANEHAKTAVIILNEVKSLLASTGASSITCVGHSLGGALAQLDALYLTLNCPSVKLNAYTYGTPRVGNQAYAALFDATVSNFKRINNAIDIVPIVPGRGLGFLHPQGEVHLISQGKAVTCPGEDDATDSQCQIQSVPTILEGDILNHLGPYNGISIGTPFCGGILGSLLGDLGI